jgi:hypothetical protein
MKLAIGVHPSSSSRPRIAGPRGEANGRSSSGGAKDRGVYAGSFYAEQLAGHVGHTARRSRNRKGGREQAGAPRTPNVERPTSNIEWGQRSRPAPWWRDAGPFDRRRAVMTKNQKPTSGSGVHLNGDSSWSGLQVKGNAPGDVRVHGESRASVGSPKRRGRPRADCLQGSDTVEGAGVHCEWCRRSGSRRDERVVRLTSGRWSTRANAGRRWRRRRLAPCAW